MKAILSEEARGVLDELARERALLVFDFDGTLAPIVERPGDASIRETTRSLLRVAALLYPCAVVSGRSRADLRPRLEGLPLVAFVGNHGAEAGFGPVDRTPFPTVGAWRQELEAALAGLPGVELEDKGLSLAIHYRRAPDPAEAQRRVRAAAEALPRARVFGGLAVVNVVPADAPDKGAAVAEILQRVGRRLALYVGDDVTDEQAFSAKAVSVGVRIGVSESSAAGFYLPGQAALDALLSALIGARRRLDGAGLGIDGLVKAAGS